ncbi:GNAT family N-acetyltransferase [Psychromonas aquimarina]|uniref:GNAT family N-acetyltransferase n=1 Tax=Psychromonas aquimarina TaxID=444919 RepID=UPI0004294E25|nr:GNAT family N-acetyltransferase [Psychromonas aquimarina]
MKLEQIGKTIKFRLVEISDAEFINSLRVDGKYNKYLSKVTGSVKDQKEWIKKYKEKEKSGIEYYFIIEKIADKTPIGTVRLYDFASVKGSFSWGSWILNENKTRLSAVESAMLVYELAFRTLQFSKCHFEVRKENKGVITFHKKMGAQIIEENEIEYFFNLNKKNYINFYNEKKHFIE